MRQSDKMDPLNSCRVCLNAQAPMFNILDSPLHGIFEKLTNMKVDLSDRSHVLCLLCHSRLKECYELVERAQNSEKYLLSLISDNTETPKDIKFNIGHSLCVSKTEISTNQGSVFEKESSETQVFKPYQIKVEYSEESNTNIGCSFNDESTETILEHQEMKVEHSAESTNTCTNSYDDLSNFDSLEVTKEEFNLSVDAQALKKDKTVNDIDNLGVTCTDTKEKHYTCSYCQHVFTTEQYFSKHLRRHTGVKPFACSICNRKFTTKSNLTTHFKIHTGEKPYACSYCDRKFTNKSHVAGHLRTHTGEKPFECSVCDRRFKTKSELTVHSRTHTGEKPYACSSCDRKFRNKSHVIEHLRTHKREKPYQCCDCNRKFMTKKKYTLHCKIHTRRLEAKVV